MSNCIAEYDWLLPEWPAPANVHALVTSRSGGVSQAPYNSMNLASHVGDDPAAVTENRRRLRECLGLEAEPLWLSQVHGTHIVDAAAAAQDVEADGSISTRPGQASVVMTADCLPVLLCDSDGTRVAAVHAGWRGLAAGAVEAAVQRLGCPPGQLLAWLGPAIGPRQFEVGGEVREAFVQQHAEAAQAFLSHGPGKWLADIYHLSRIRLSAMGLSQVYGGGACSYEEAERYYSYRRDKTTGRMASLIWFD